MKKKTILKHLREARSHATMVNADFDSIGGSSLVCYSKSGRRQTDAVEETEYIKERTRLYRETWIIGFIDMAIAELENGK